MAIPDDIREPAARTLAEFCRSHTTEAVADQLRYEYSFAGNAALLIERRPSFMNPSEWTSRAVAKFRYSAGKGVWTLYWADRNDKWHRVSSAPAAARIDSLLAQVLADPSGVFCG
jgi:hypothetical protein